jgi:hypothetical protein
VLRMLEIKSEKYKDLSYVLAAEDYSTIHLLIVRTGENQSIQLKESKNVSSSRRIFTQRISGPSLHPLFPLECA